MYSLFDFLEVDPHAHEFIKGEAAIARAAGFKDARYFADRYLTGASSSSVVAPGLLSRHFPFGHCYLVNGELETHPSSATALGRHVHEATTATRLEQTLGWRGSRGYPEPTAPGTASNVAVGLPAEASRDGLLIRVVGSADGEPGQGSGG